MKRCFPKREDSFDVRFCHFSGIFHLAVKAIQTGWWHSYSFAFTRKPRVLRGICKVHHFIVYSFIIIIILLFVDGTMLFILPIFFFETSEILALIVKKKLWLFGHYYDLWRCYKIIIKLENWSRISWNITVPKRRESYRRDSITVPKITFDINLIHVFITSTGPSIPQKPYSQPWNYWFWNLPLDLNIFFLKNLKIYELLFFLQKLSSYEVTCRRH